MQLNLKRTRSVRTSTSQSRQVPKVGADRRSGKASAVESSAPYHTLAKASPAMEARDE